MRLFRNLLFLMLILLLGACARSAPPLPPPVPDPEISQLEASVFLIGDGGKPKPGGEPVLIALENELKDRPDSTVIVFLGDNLYSVGLPDSTSKDIKEMRRRLDDQIAVVARSGARAIFIPGNHDWARGGDDGWQSVLRQERRIATRGDQLAIQLPPGGCPGPSVVDVGEQVRLVLIDTQWWLQGGPKPYGDSSNCVAGTEQAIVDSLRSVLATAGDRHVIVCGHHPFQTSGKHGGFFPWEDYFFPLREIKSWMWLPLPIIGAAYPLSRKAGISNQDLSGGNNKKMVAALREALAQDPPLIYACGHEHILEVLKGDSAQYLLVSGGGYYNHSSPVTALGETRYVASKAGFMRVDVLKDGKVRLGVFEVDKTGESIEAFSIMLE